mmetsp:Transcript_67563/g.187344  ORF Transcript_67563/g.187344 Transcript_67563/m.187344 type:complete len:245 (+) Transcript_67563:2167-2901(+)
MEQLAAGVADADGLPGLRAAFASLAGADGLEGPVRVRVGGVAVAVDGALLRVDAQVAALEPRPQRHRRAELDHRLERRHLCHLHFRELLLELLHRRADIRLLDQELGHLQQLLLLPHRPVRPELDQVGASHDLRPDQEEHQVQRQQQEAHVPRIIAVVLQLGHLGSVLQQAGDAGGGLLQEIIEAVCHDEPRASLLVHGERCHHRSFAVLADGRVGRALDRAVGGELREVLEARVLQPHLRLFG